MYCTAGLRCHFLSFSVYRQRMALRMAKNATPTSANTASHMGALPSAPITRTMAFTVRAKTMFSRTIRTVLRAMRMAVAILVG